MLHKDNHKKLKRRRLREADFSATIDDHNRISEVGDGNDEPVHTDKTHRSKHKFSLKSLSKKQKIIASLVIIIVIVILALLLTHHSKPGPVISINSPVKKTVAPKVITSPLDGLPVTLAQSELPITAIMIENSDAARPQSGLSQAGVVLEALTEGGITRFEALYQEGAPTSIGPIRSARPVFIDFELPFNATYVHVGGSPDALTQITTDKVKDLNQFYFGSYFTRITTREAPHNVYTSMSELYSAEKSQGYDTTSYFSSWPRKTDSPSKDPTATSIQFEPSYQDFQVNYTYDSANDSYLRSEAGSTMTDANTGKQLDPKVVIGIVMPASQGALDSSGAYYTDYNDIGSGQADVFEDGTVTIGTWSKSSPTSMIEFNNSNGTPIKLNAGQTWITVLSAANQISYSK